MLRKWFLALVLFTFILIPAVVQSSGSGGELIGTYQVSFMYNVMAGGGSIGIGNPVGSMNYCGVPTAPIMVSGLQPGIYTAKVVPGSESGNPGCQLPGDSATFFVDTFWDSLVHVNNPSAVKPDTGFDGGTTQPVPANWVYSGSAWVGASETDGVRYDFPTLPAPVTFEVKAGQNVWFYRYDWAIVDNLGGLTIELRRTSVDLTQYVSAAYDDVNEDGGTFRMYDRQLWVGTGQNPAKSYAGIRFSNLEIPAGATIVSARLELYSRAYSWIRMDMFIAADANANSAPFSWNNRPSQRALTVNRVQQHSNRPWGAGTWNSLGELKSVVQEVVNNPGWHSGNSLSLIVKGTGAPWGRKFVSSFDFRFTVAPRLVVRYIVPSS